MTSGPRAGSETVDGYPQVVEGGFDLDAFLAEERRRVDAALARSLSRWQQVLPKDVARAVAHGVEGGGKRLRPALCVTAYRACGGTGGEPAYDLAAALELIHAYSLMHDDLPCMDDAELRRGVPATHRVFGERATIVAGAAMIPFAALQALEACRALSLPDRSARDVVAELCKAAGGGGMVGGQVLDLLAEGRTLDGRELDELHALKTGALLTAALRMGGRAAGASEAVLAALDAYGRAVGLAFQITDDVLDATATAEALGKRPSDTTLGKSTYVSLHGVAEARRRADRLVAHALGVLDGAGLPSHAGAAAPLHALAVFAVSRGH
jgi:geranylgeranyl diphosphate synthase type II